MNSGRRTARQEEELHVQRRNAELRKQEHWNNVADYFKTWDVKASKYSSWTSPQYFQQNQVARVEAENKEKKQQTLAERREKLKDILEKEEKMLEMEMKSNYQRGKASSMPLEELKSVNLELKRRAVETQKRESELFLYQRWKQEQPTLRDLERRQHLEFMKKSWIDQVKQREAAKEKLKAEEALRAKEEELKQKEKEEFERLLKARKEEEIKELKQQIKLQMEEIAESVKKYKELEKQEAEERRVQNEIEEMLTQRKLAEKKQANKELVSYWSKQYQLKLQKKAKEVEEEIMQDQKMLQRLEEECNKETEVKALAREIAKQEVELALKELQIQREREHLRQKEYDRMFFEESKRAWEIQEGKWEQERKARDRLMKKVLETLKVQVEEKLRRNAAKKAEALKEREQLLQGMNRLYEQCNERDQDTKLAQEQYRKELDFQITQKRIEEVRKAYEKAEEEKNITQFELDAEKKLAAEIEKLEIAASSYTPPDFRRRRIVW